MRALLRATLAASLLVLAQPLRAEDPPPPPGTEAVAPELLHGRTLYLEKANCSVDAPPGYEWLASPGMTEKHPEVRMFLCRDPRENRIFMVQVYDKGFASLDEKGMDEFIQGARGSMEQQGWKFLETKKSPAALPIEQSSFSFQVKLLRKDGQEIHWVGYVGTAQKMYCVSAMQLEPGERPEFHAFVKSFKLLHPVSKLGSWIGLLPYVLLSLVVGSAVVFISQRQAAKAAAAKPAAAAAADEDDESDETDAFKPKPIVPSKGAKTRRDVPRDLPREIPAKPAASKPAAKPVRPAKPDEKSDRPRKNERPFG